MKRNEYGTLSTALGATVIKKGGIQLWIRDMGVWCIRGADLRWFNFSGLIMRDVRIDHDGKIIGD